MTGVLGNRGIEGNMNMRFGAFDDSVPDSLARTRHDRSFEVVRQGPAPARPVTPGTKGRQVEHYKQPVVSLSDEKEQESDEDEAIGNRKKAHKGLKLLSIVVRDIVIEKKSSTYKEVADLILRDSMRDGQLNPSHKNEVAKEEQNIKRRVYDALNVLISAGVLVKEGKRVRKNDTLSQVKVNGKRCEINSMANKLVS